MDREKGFFDNFRKILLESSKMKIEIDVHGDQILLVGSGRQLPFMETTFIHGNNENEGDLSFSSIY